MSWKCRRCGGSKFFAECPDDEPKFLGCLECNWDVAVEYEWPGPQRCVAHTMGAHGRGVGRRCTREAIGRGVHCWQHSDHVAHWEAIYEHFRTAGDSYLPEFYRQMFVRALRDAEIIIRDEEHEAELVERVRQVRAKPETGASLVYFIEREGLIKIGFSTNLKKRLKDISKGSSMPDGMTIGPVTLLATEPGDRNLESRLHRRFDRSRVDNTEWFRPSKALRRYIEDLARHQQRANAA